MQMQKNCSFTHFQTMKNKHQKAPVLYGQGLYFFHFFNAF
ncbi:hypothetical protein BAT_3985 [Bacillus pumilus ATCC 7061]|nr:hypothetical protein BAT_3985 [Bacillus pumilus ATCC 7061]